MRLLGLLLSFLLVTDRGFAHEYWIEPVEHQVAIDQEIVANFRNGVNFNGGALGWYDARSVRAEVWSQAKMTQLSGRAGDLPAIRIGTPTEGLLTLAQETAMQTLTYRDPEKFQNFINHKDFGLDALDETYPFKEGYRRFAKSLVTAGSTKGSDQKIGFEIELVALANPYEIEGTALPVQLFYQNAPLPNTQIEVYEKSEDAETTVRLYRTDAKGRAILDVKAGHRYLVDAVILRRPNETIAQERGIIWESLWAALTFEVPAH
jgi:hypothetical protein